MISVVLDSNAFHGARWLRSVSGQKLIEMAAAASCEMILPQVVVDKLERQHREALIKQRDEARAALSEVESIVDINEIVAKFDELISKVNVQRDAMLALTGVRAVPVPANITRELVERDLQRRRPFIESDSGKRSRTASAMP